MVSKQAYFWPIGRVPDRIPLPYRSPTSMVNLRPQQAATTSTSLILVPSDRPDFSTTAVRVNSEAIVDGGDMQYSRSPRQLCLNNSFSHVGKHRHRYPRLNMNSASASDWRAKRVGLDVDRPIIVRSLPLFASLWKTLYSATNWRLVYVCEFRI